MFHGIFRDNDTTTAHFMYSPNHKVEATQFINGLPCILSEELLINPNDFITRSGLEQATLVVWDKLNGTFTNTNELHN